MMEHVLDDLMKKMVGVWSEKERNDDALFHVAQLFLLGM